MTLNDSVQYFIRAMIGIGVIVFMVSGSFLSQQLQTNFGFNRPYFITFFNTLFLCTLLPSHFSIWFIIYCGKRYKLNYNTVERDQKFINESLNSENQEFLQIQRHKTESVFVLFKKRIEQEAQLSLLQLWCFAFPFCFLWITANYLYVFALSLTDVASALSLEQTSTAFVFVLSIFIVQERVTILKVCSVLLCVIGAIIVGFGDAQATSQFSEQEPKSAWIKVVGDFVVVISCVAAAVYMVMNKRVLRHVTTSLSVHAFLTFIGLWNFIVFWIPMIPLHFTHYETFPILPSHFNKMSSSFWIVLGLLFLNAIMSLLFNVLLNIGIVFYSPLFMRLVVLCSIPSSFAVELMVQGHSALNAMRVVGAVVICIGFLGFCLTLIKTYNCCTTFAKSEETKEDPYAQVNEE